MRFFVVLVACLAGCGGARAWQRGDVGVRVFTHDSTNAYLVAQHGALVLVDSGYERNAPALDRDIRAAGFDPARIRAVVVTHGHADHAGGAAWFQRRYGAKLVAGAADRDMLAAGRNEPLCPTGLLGKLRRSTDQRARFSPETADVWIDAPAPLAAVAGVDGTIVPLPGHTRGSLVVLVGDLVFVGDLMRGSVVGSGAETHLYMCDLPANRRDVGALLHTLAPSATLFLPGHFGALSRDAVTRHFEH